jgi:predicted N-acetyltransferase YhbS
VTSSQTGAGRSPIAAVNSESGAPSIDTYAGSRAALFELFSLAEDSHTQLADYIELGDVLVARLGATIVGHVQLTSTADPAVSEIKNMAVVPEFQRRGIGSSLVQAATDAATANGARSVVVGTATADVDNLSFYQRCGFRLSRIERDAFSPATGYPDPIVINGIPLCDRVWLDKDLDIG